MVEIKKAFSKRTRKSFTPIGETMTQQQFKKECDINNVLKKYQKTGLVSHVNSFQGSYTDLSQPVDYQTAMNIILNANAAFDTLPSSIRKQFDNDPHTFLTFVSDPANEQAMIDLGLKKPPVVVTQDPAAPPQDEPTQEV